MLHSIDIYIIYLCYSVGPGLSGTEQACWLTPTMALKGKTKFLNTSIWKKKKTPVSLG